MRVGQVPISAVVFLRYNISMSVSPESLGAPETAFDLTEPERMRVYGVIVRILQTRGTTVNPDPETVYRDEHGKEYTPNPYQEATLHADELSTFGLPYDRVVVTSQDPSEGFDDPPIPGLISLVTTTTTSRPMPTRDGLATTSGFGTEQKGVSFKDEEGLGVMVEGEGGEVELRDGEPSDRATTTDASGKGIELVGTPVFSDEAPPLTRQEILDITTALETLN